MGIIILCLDDEAFNSKHKNILLRAQTDQFNWIHGRCPSQAQGEEAPNPPFPC